MNRHSMILLAVLFSLPWYSLTAGSGEDHIEALLTAPLRTRYVNDGAADATVTETPTPEIRRIVDLHDKAIPLLIACLDDSRPTQAVYLENSQRYQVPLGYVCLDILMNVVKAPQILREDCADDGLGACVAEPYYYRPDITRSKDPGQSMRAVKSKWTAAYKEGKLKFVYPSWWDQRLGGQPRASSEQLRRR